MDPYPGWRRLEELEAREQEEFLRSFKGGQGRSDDDVRVGAELVTWLFVASVAGCGVWVVLALVPTVVNAVRAWGGWL